MACRTRRGDARGSMSGRRRADTGSSRVSSRGCAPRAPRRCARCRRRRRPPARRAASGRSRAARRARRRPTSTTSAARRSPAGRCARRPRPAARPTGPAPAMITRRPRILRVLARTRRPCRGRGGPTSRAPRGGCRARRAPSAAFSIAGMSLLEPMTMPTRGASTSMPSNSASTAVSVRLGVLGCSLMRGDVPAQLACRRR